MLQRGLAVVQRGLAVVLLTQLAPSRPTYWAAVISLQQSYSLQQLQDLLHLQRGHRLAEKDLERARSE